MWKGDPVKAPQCSKGTFLIVFLAVVFVLWGTALHANLSENLRQLARIGGLGCALLFFPLAWRIYRSERKPAWRYAAIEWAAALWMLPIVLAVAVLSRSLSESGSLQAIVVKAGAILVCFIIANRLFLRYERETDTKREAEGNPGQTTRKPRKPGADPE